jgi:A/G-specific adenine glycosylase
MGEVEPEVREAHTLRLRLLEWYVRSRRDLPWRRTRDPYAIWVSEIMLQQTRVAAVMERYREFMVRFPTVVSLAQAQEQDVLALWSGLGYYRRAHMLHKAAQIVAEHHGGVLPATAAELRPLPGIGGYTAAAIASIAHGEPVAVVDGNVERVLCRLEGWSETGSKGALRRKIEELAGRLVDPERPGDFNQAMMELGATVCLPRNPQCLVCPLAATCKTRGEHKTTARPRMESREAGHALAVRVGPSPSADESSLEVLLEQRPATQTVMPGLWELPVLRDPAVAPEDLHMTLRHAIMQVNYEVRIRSVSECDVQSLTLTGGERRWVLLNQAMTMALTGMTRKVLTRIRLLEAKRADGSAVQGKHARP